MKTLIGTYVKVGKLMKFTDRRGKVFKTADFQAGLTFLKRAMA